MPENAILHVAGNNCYNIRNSLKSPLDGGIRELKGCERKTFMAVFLTCTLVNNHHHHHPSLIKVIVRGTVYVPPGPSVQNFQPRLLPGSIPVQPRCVIR